MQPYTGLHLLLRLLLVASLLAACAEQPKRPPVDYRSNPEYQRAKKLEGFGYHVVAGELYQELAQELPPPQKGEVFLLAGNAFVNAGKTDRARAVATQIPDETAPLALAAGKRLLLARINVTDGNLPEAMRILEVPPPVDAPRNLRAEYWRTRAAVSAQSGYPIASASALGQLDLVLTDREERLENQQNIVVVLSELEPEQRQASRAQASDNLRGWLEFTDIYVAHGRDLAKMAVALDEWRTRHPLHPADPVILQTLRAQPRGDYGPPEQIAVMLPASGRFAAAGEALRRGILTAYYDQPDAARPVMRFLDSSDIDDIWPLYQQAVAEGADTVIGPLSKSAVAQLARAGELDTRVVALNQVAVEVLPPADLFQFGLSPEDEAMQVAERARLDGHRKALVLAPTGDWGDRLLESFSRAWEASGGILLEVQRYAPEEHDFSEPIQSLLDLDDSKARMRELQKALRRNLRFEPSRRADADFIFLIAQSLNARQIVPQLRFHHALDLPLYSTSHVYPGNPDQTRDIDLEGLVFCDMPWTLERDSESSRNHYSDTRYTRLYAMGIDSYNLIEQLRRLRTSADEVFEGKTGVLSLTPEQHVHRKLVWARMQHGQPQLFEDNPPPGLATGEENAEAADISSRNINE